MSESLVSKSKFLSLVLRHKPEEIGLSLDAEGWAELDQLIQLASDKGIALTRELVLEIVSTSDKKRFVVDPTGERIRANQGHSIKVDLGLTPQQPPGTLFHGTATRFAASIRESGLLPGARQHVHLSSAETTARDVGARHGSPVVLIVNAVDMHRDGHEFFLSANGVWLANAVPPRYLRFPDEVE
ncbi:RNA 2'-phosphotransferase [Montanilutibacter psychrotolerans]|uniref:Probable RNA 2'-phosphotransferase n=1 Tax=Montanilutibacter psychrotolerans TaxID=1327343 RepID=A0A3M8SSH8_9GAMM|nr:RNA 2'-phosphotransferase [Lysobacter psychrotolerans]RNF84301.1 RNA 2'-phosphotransferase [Lysobacter psychrotolerans]